MGTSASLNAKINEVKSEIPNITILATTTTTAPTALENKMPNISNLVKKKKKNYYSTKISEIATDNDHDKYITTQEFKKLTSENLLQD